MNFKTEKQTNKERAKNLILQEYLSASTNYVICMDITTLKKQGQLLIAVELASRAIVGHCFSKEINTDDVCFTINHFVKNRSFLPQTNIIHTDRGAVFSNEKYYHCLQLLNIKRSRGSAKAHQNQVIERLNRTLKDILRNKMDSQWKINNIDPLLNMEVPFEQMSQVVKESIEFYNNKKHSSLFFMTPNLMEEALFNKHKNQLPENKQLLLAKNKTLQGDLLKQYKYELVHKFKGDWETFFIEWEKKQTYQFNEIIKTIKEKAQQTENEYQSLFKQNLDLQIQLEEINKKNQQDIQKEKDIQFKKEKRKNAKKLPLRDTISLEDFKFILTIVKGRNGVLQRKRAALILLFLTGLRVSNLLIFKVYNAFELLDKGYTKISLIKGGEQRFHLQLSNKGLKLLNEFRTDFLLLSKDKFNDSPLFSPIDDKNKSLPRESFDKELNKILNKASGKLEKYIRTHSFRATLITELLESTPIDQVKDIIGHRSINSTLEYKRSKLKPEQIKRILSRRDVDIKKIK